MKCLALLDDALEFLTIFQRARLNWCAPNPMLKKISRSLRGCEPHRPNIGRGLQNTHTTMVVVTGQKYFRMSLTWQRADGRSLVGCCNRLSGKLEVVAAVWVVGGDCCRAGGCVCRSNLQPVLQTRYNIGTSPKRSLPRPGFRPLIGQTSARKLAAFGDGVTLEYGVTL